MEQDRADEDLLQGLASKARRSLRFPDAGISSGTECLQEGFETVTDKVPVIAISSNDVREEQWDVAGSEGLHGTHACSASPQFKRPWKAPRPSAIAQLYKPRKAAVSLAIRFAEEPSSSLEESGKSSCRSEDGGEESQDSPEREVVEFPEVEERGQEDQEGPLKVAQVKALRLSGGARSLPLVEEELGAEFLGCVNTHSSSSLAAHVEKPCTEKLAACGFQGSSIDHGDTHLHSLLREGDTGGWWQGPEQSWQGSACASASSSSSAVLATPLGQEAHPVESRSVMIPEEWKADPVFKGMDYVGCAHQYTQHHYVRFLQRSASVQSKGQPLVPSDTANH